jgi:hypothetical protein
MTYLPDFAAYLVGSFRDGAARLDVQGDITIRDDVTTYVYRGIAPRWHVAFFDWASGAYTASHSRPERLAGSIEYGFAVESGFEPPGPIPADDSDEYQAWLDGPYNEALTAWCDQDRPKPINFSTNDR